MSYRYKPAETPLARRPNIHKCNALSELLRKPAHICTGFLFRAYRIICTTNAVVCGGILAVIKEACSTLTRSPGRSTDRLVRLPKKSRITVSGVIWNWMAEAGFWFGITIRKRPRVFTCAILPVVVSVFGALAVILIKNACACGGMLLVMAAEKLASTVMPRSNSPARTRIPCSLKISVSRLTTRRTVSVGVAHPSQL